MNSYRFTARLTARWTFRSLLLLSGFSWLMPTVAQEDPARSYELPAAQVIAPDLSRAEALADTVGTVIMAGKRTTTVRPGAQRADLSVNAARQVFARVPGITVWENDGSGAQLSIATRGLSPNRSWEFNMRQNGHDICADVFGYPEAYYTPPMEAVDRINVVRGAATLAYGPQFGGLVDFRLKHGASDKPFALETRQTVGSFGSLNSYNAIGGTKGRLNYYTYLHRRSAEGWRENSRYTTTSLHGSLEYQAGRRWKLGAEITRMDLESQQPGGLTDARFDGDPSSSTRARNWMLLPWHTGAVTAEFRAGARTLLQAQLFGTISERNSVGFLKPIDQPDTVNTATGEYAPRQVDRDAYTNAGLEVRVRQGWRFMGRDAQLSAGVRAYGAHTDRRQQGTGTTGSDADLEVTGAYGRELDLATNNGAAHMELLLPVSERISITPGARFEHIVSRVDGRINTSNGAIDSGERVRDLLLPGVGAQWRATSYTTVYANYCRSYRPVLYSDLTPSATTDVIDPDLHDAQGHTVDLGYRGRAGDHITFDVGGYRLVYDDRIGTLSIDGVNHRTNIGTSVSTGVEIYAEAEILGLLGARHEDRRLSLFASYAYTDARYTRWNDPAREQDPAKSIEGKRVEYAPEWTLRSGVELRWERFSASMLVNAVDGVYTDANNTGTPNSSATSGWIPGYVLLDANLGWSFTRSVSATVGVNNMADTSYATRRSGGYPGPGLLPGTGRAWYITLEARL